MRVNRESRENRELMIRVERMSNSSTDKYLNSTLVSSVLRQNVNYLGSFSFDVSATVRPTLIPSDLPVQACYPDTSAMRYPTIHLILRLPHTRRSPPPLVSPAPVRSI